MMNEGKIQWSLIPPELGPAPTGETNLIWITSEEHVELVKWWDELNRRRDGINMLDWSEDDEFAATVSTYSIIIANRPEDADLYFQRGIALSNLEQFDEAIADFDKALSLDPQHAGAQLYRAQIQSAIAGILNDRGCLHIESGNLTLALEDFDEAIRLDPTNAITYSNRGALHSKLGQLQRAIEDYGAAIRCDPDYANSYANRAFVYYKLGEYEKGIADCEQALALRPNHSNTYINRGHCFAGLGDSERAAADFRFALAPPCEPGEGELKEARDGLRALGLE